MKTWWGQPWVRWPHKDDAMRQHGVLMIGGEYKTPDEARDIATAIMRLLMEDAGSKAVKNA